MSGGNKPFAGVFEVPLDVDIDDGDSPPPSTPNENDARPTVKAPEPKRAPKPARSLDQPHSPEAERALLACLFLDGEDTLQKCHAHGITLRSFYDAPNRILFDCIESVYKRGHAIEIGIVAQELIQTKQLNDIGGYPYLAQVTSETPTTAQANYFVQQVSHFDRLRKALRTANRILEKANDGADAQEIIAEATQELAELTGTPKIRRPVRPITDYGYPDGDDPNTLLGTDDYLGRGGGFLFVSHAGAGKSSWIMDACMSWALGKPWMGIRCAKPLKSLIVQAEDSDRYVGKVQASFAHANQLTAEQQAIVGQNCVITRLKGVSGPEFFGELRQLAKAHTPDLVVINPLYLYADGDIGRPEFAQPFLKSLDEVNVEEKFAYILVHHTGKPTAKGANGKRAAVDDWESVYQGFGSSYLANWPRCSALLEPVPEANGRYTIKLGKGGYNAGVTKQVPQGAGFRDEPVTRIAIRHSTAKMTVGERERPVYYWEADDTPPSEGESDKPKGGRKFKYDFADYRSVIPASDAKPLPLAELHRACEAQLPIPRQRLHDALKRWADEGLIAIITADGQTTKYRRAL